VFFFKFCTILSIFQSVTSRFSVVLVWCQK